MSRHNTARSSHQVGSDHAALACQQALPPPELKHPSPTASFFASFLKLLILMITKDLFRARGVWPAWAALRRAQRNHPRREMHEAN